MSVPTPAASVVLARSAGGDELYLVRRAANLRFFGGFHVFPGGKVDAADAALADAFLDVRRVAAARELFEETGVLLARRADGSPLDADARQSLRRELVAGRRTFADVLARLDARVAADALVRVGDLVTPPFSSLRFDTTFFVADLPPGQQPDVWTGELTDGAWATADDALGAWERGETLLSPPTVALLQAVSGRPVVELPARAAPLFEQHQAGALPPIWFSPAVQMLPLRCEGLPPASYTNALLVGTGPRYLIDPGPTDPAEQALLFRALDAETLARRPLEAVLLTHHHPDHVGAAAAVAGRYGVPVRAHPWTAAALAGSVEVGPPIDDGDRIDLGPAPHGRGRWHLEALHTPGHAPGHLVFYEPSYQLVIAGDLVSTLSSVVIAPPEGDLGQYLASLERVRALPCRLLLPAHGSPSSRPAALLAEAVEHRRQREQQLRAALAAGLSRLEDLTRELYRGLPDNLARLAEAQTLAGLEKLQREGAATRHGDDWRPSVPASGGV